MSASNWDHCPRCRARSVAERNAARALAEQSYGRVPHAEYRRLLADASRDVELQRTLREDWELGVAETMTGATFFVVYRCECRECGFVHVFRHEERVEIGSDE